MNKCVIPATLVGMSNNWSELLRLMKFQIIIIFNCKCLCDVLNAVLRMSRHVCLQDWPLQGGVNLLPSVGNRELLVTGYLSTFVVAE